MKTQMQTMKDDMLLDIVGGGSSYCAPAPCQSQCPKPSCGSVLVGVLFGTAAVINAASDAGICGKDILKLLRTVFKIVK